MDFYYDPIKGLVYNFFEPIIMLDINMLPKDTPTIEEEMYLLRERGVSLINSTEIENNLEITPVITTNAYLCN